MIFVSLYAPNGLTAVRIEGFLPPHNPRLWQAVAGVTLCQLLAVPTANEVKEGERPPEW